MNTKNIDSSGPGASDLHENAPPKNPWLGSTGFWLMIVIAGFYLVTEHRAHLIAGLAWLPAALLFACLLMHVFGHGGHGGHAAHKDNSQPPADDTNPTTQGADVATKTNARKPNIGGDLP